MAHKPDRLQQTGRYGSAGAIVSHQPGYLTLSCSCITFCVTPTRLPRSGLLLHHFLCRTSPATSLRAAPASLFVSHQPGHLTLSCSCITFCVTPTRLPRSGLLLHHFLCHTSPATSLRATPASLFVSHQPSYLTLSCSCITFCVTPTRLPRSGLFVHHFLCHTSPATSL